MALTPHQRDVCRLLARGRIASGESYVAGGAALNELLAAPRLSEDIDLFHDTDAALDASFRGDRTLLESERFTVLVLRERPSFVEAAVSRDGQTVIVQWVRDSAYRFFPLVSHAELGLVLHPFDLATNKVLALVGRLEPRDWVDVLTCDEKIQPLGYLLFAACGKDPGFSPTGLLEHASRSGRYTADDLAGLSFDGPAPDVRALSVRWHAMLSTARDILAALPAAEAGHAVLGVTGRPYRGSPEEIMSSLRKGEVTFHAGRIRGVWPKVEGADGLWPIA